MNPDLENQIRIAGEAVSQMYSASKAEMTEIEASLWTREIGRLGPAAMLAFVEFWISGGAQNGFHRAPKIEDFLNRADPEYIGAEVALERLRVEVVQCGPWRSPEIGNPKMQATVMRLGGWAKVCEDMPDTSNTFAYKQFSERFRAAWLHAESLQIQQKLLNQPLQGLISQPLQLRLKVEVSDVPPSILGFSPSENDHQRP